MSTTYCFESLQVDVISVWYSIDALYMTVCFTET